jgi:hypothetical protein
VVGRLPAARPCGQTAEEDFILATEELVDPGPRVDPHAADLEAEILGILERTLALENVACQEAALHGLRHRHHKHASQVEVIVDTYLRRHLPTWLPDEQGESLRGYALAARGRQGAVIVAAARPTASGRRVQQRFRTCAAPSPVTGQQRDRPGDA